MSNDMANMKKKDTKKVADEGYKDKAKTSIYVKKEKSVTSKGKALRKMC